MMNDRQRKAMFANMMAYTGPGRVIRITPPVDYTPPTEETIPIWNPVSPIEGQWPVNWPTEWSDGIGGGDHIVPRFIGSPIRTAGAGSPALSGRLQRMGGRDSMRDILKARELSTLRK